MLEGAPASPGPLRDFAQTSPFRHEPAALTIPLPQPASCQLAAMGSSDPQALSALLVISVGLLAGRHGGVKEATLAVARGEAPLHWRRLCFDWNAQTTLQDLTSRLAFDATAVAAHGGSRAAPGASASGATQEDSQSSDDEPAATDVLPAHQQPEIEFDFRCTADAFEARLSHNALLYRHDSMAVLARQWCHVLTRALDGPSQWVASIELHDSQERDRILHGFNRNRLPFPRDRTLSDLILAQARTSPDTVCAVHGEQALTYGCLDEIADRLASLLRTLGVGPGVFVAIFEPRGLHFVTAMVAIWKAGGAYVPVETDYPADRVRHMLADSEARVLIVGETGLARLGVMAASLAHLVGIVCLDGITTPPPMELDCPVYGPRDFGQRPLAGDCPGPANARDPAYMVYTSGSTGLPKGAIVRHDGAVNHIFAQAHCLGRTAVMNFLQSAPSSSDISVWQFAAPLVLGGRTVIMDGASDVEALVEQVRRHRPGIIELVPSVMSHLIDFLASLPAAQRELPGLRWAMVTGESAQVALINAWLALYPSIPVVNAYGPTEAADDIAQAIIERPLPPRLLTAPIGHSLPNLDVHVLDDRLEPAPIGVPGQICVAGIGVGVGYWKQDEKTRASFRPNPLPDAQGDTLYLTGDIGRRLDDGTLECFGRQDRQVKLHGFRIELAEIETALNGHAAIKEAVVIVTTGRAAHPQLVAFVVERGRTGLAAADVRGFLAAQLPKHMLPSHVVVLPNMPLSPAGKIDRQALSQMPLPHDLPLARAAAPADAVQAVLCRIWREELGCPEIGVDDNFFDLGGDSMTALGIVSGARSAGLRIRPSDVFDHPTITRLATIARRVQPEPPAVVVSRPPATHDALTPAERLAILMTDPGLDDAYALSPTQRSIYLHALLCTDKSAYVDQYCYRLQGPLDRQAFDAQWQVVMERQPALRSAVSRRHHRRPIQVVHRDVTLPMTWLDASDLAPSAREALLADLRAADAQRGFLLDTAPLMRLTVVKLDALSHYFFWTHHHLILDGWSMSLVVGEVMAGLTGQPKAVASSPQAPVPRDLVDWQLQQDPEIDEGFWRQLLSGWTSDKQWVWPVIADRRQSFAALDHALSIDITQQLARHAAAQGVTTGTLLHAGWALLLSRMTGRNDVLFGTVSSGREIGLPGIESLVGLAIATLPLRLDVSAHAAHRAWLQAVQTAAAATREHQTLSTDEIQRRCVPGLKGPLFETLLVVSNYPQVMTPPKSRVAIEAAEFRTVPAYPVTLVATPGQALSLRLVHDQRRCDAETAEALLNDYSRIIEQLAAGVDVRHAAQRTRTAPEPGAVAESPESRLTPQHAGEAAHGN